LGFPFQFVYKEFLIMRRLSLTRLTLITAFAASCLLANAQTTFAQAGVSPGDVVINEFRYRGPGGVRDEFIELYNTTDADIVVRPAGSSTAVRCPRRRSLSALWCL
jgi:hypothetical protein